MTHERRVRLALAASLGVASLLIAPAARAQQISIDTSAGGSQQTIDGFGTCLAGTEGQQSWFQQMYFDDLRASILRVDITPHFASPYSDNLYVCPWYGGSITFPGPDGNNVRTYTGPSDYSRSFAGQSAPIAVMGPDIDQNVTLFDYTTDTPQTQGMMAALGTSKKAELGDFKLYGTMWSPEPWVKVSTGHMINGQSGNLPANGTAWPFIWGGNFSGGKLDVSGTPLAVFDDSSLGGTGPTSALTQFARARPPTCAAFRTRSACSSTRSASRTS